MGSMMEIEVKMSKEAMAAFKKALVEKDWIRDGEKSFETLNERAKAYCKRNSTDNLKFFASLKEGGGKLEFEYIKTPNPYANLAALAFHLSTMMLCEDDQKAAEERMQKNVTPGHVPASLRTPLEDAKWQNPVAIRDRIMSALLADDLDGKMDKELAVEKGKFSAKEMESYEFVRELMRDYVKAKEEAKKKSEESKKKTEDSEQQQAA